MKFPSILFMLLVCLPNVAFAWTWFQNTEQQAKTAFEQEQYNEAAKLFNDPYKRGVALYREGQYAAAAEAFDKVTNPKSKLKAQYNLGNAHFQQNDYEKAIKAYEQVLAEQPTHEDARFNLELAKKQMEQQSQSQQSEQNDSEQSEQNKENSSESEQQNGQNEQGNESEASEQNQSQQGQQNEQNQQQQSPSDNETEQDDASQQAQSAQEAEQDSENAEQQAQQMSEENQDEMAENGGASSDEQIYSETDMMADALLNRIAENPQQLLKGQFYIDAHNANTKQPEKPW